MVCCAPMTMTANFHGIMRQPTGVANRHEAFARSRFELRNVWNSLGKKVVDTNTGKTKALTSTPFRIVFNASNLTESGVQSACNPKYVYDHSDFTRFKKQSAMKNSYNNNK